jgi:hypothetical protein
MQATNRGKIFLENKLMLGSTILMIKFQIHTPMDRIKQEKSKNINYLHGTSSLPQQSTVIQLVKNFHIFTKHAVKNDPMGPALSQSIPLPRYTIFLKCPF